MEKYEYFKKELSYIKNVKMLDNAKKLINLLPDYFFKVAASSTGKYHPSFAQGDGGLVRHTKAAVRLAYELLINQFIGKSFTDDEKDLILIALIMHDGCKHGLIETKYTVADHPLIVARLIRENKDKLTLSEDELELLCSMIETHMGEFNKDYKGNTLMPLPHNRYQNFVHMCDYLASKKFLDIHFKENDIVEE